MAQVVESQKDATAVSVQTQSGMELDISRKHAASKSNPPKAGPLIASGRSLRMECHVWVSQIYHLALLPLTALCLTLRQLAAAERKPD